MVVNAYATFRNLSDLGADGHVWALTAGRASMQLWQVGTNTYCVKRQYMGTFTTFAGVSPEGTGTVSVGVTGRWNGEIVAVIHGTFAPKVATSGFVGDFDGQCQQDGTCLGPFSIRGSTSPASTPSTSSCSARRTQVEPAVCGASHSTATPATSSARRLIPRERAEAGQASGLCSRGRLGRSRADFLGSGRRGVLPLKLVVATYCSGRSGSRDSVAGEVTGSAGGWRGSGSQRPCAGSSNPQLLRLCPRYDRNDRLVGSPRPRRTRARPGVTYQVVFVSLSTTMTATALTRLPHCRRASSGVAARVARLPVSLTQLVHGGCGDKVEILCPRPGGSRRGLIGAPSCLVTASRRRCRIQRLEARNVLVRRWPDNVRGELPTPGSCGKSTAASVDRASGLLLPSPTRFQVGTACAFRHLWHI